MTCEDFMSHARAEIAQIFDEKRDAMLKLVAQARDEGKRNAETEQLSSIMGEALDRLNEKPKTGIWLPFAADAQGYTNSFRCTNCWRSIRLHRSMSECEYAFCPNCGARMEAGKK